MAVERASTLKEPKFKYVSIFDVIADCDCPKHRPGTIYWKGVLLLLVDTTKIGSMHKVDVGCSFYNV